MIAVRVVAVAGLVALSAAGLVPTAVAADRAGLPGFCPDANGVTVIVDFQELGGTTIVRCAPGEQATGLAALKNAGIQITGTQRWGEAFICRIEGKPDLQAEACVNTPPATAYWSYWYAPNEGSWKYSELGVLNRKPPFGSFEGWSFSKDKTASTNPPPRVTPRRPAAPPPVAPPPPGNGQPANPPPAAPPPVNQPQATTTAPTMAGMTESVLPSSGAPASSESSTAPVSGTTASWTGDVEQIAAQRDSGPPTGMLVGVGIIVLLAAGAGGIAVRRRRAATGRGEQEG